MIKTLWFLTKLSLTIGAAVWLGTRKGSVDIDLMGYSLTIQAGAFLLTLFLAFFILFFVYRIIRAIFRAPKALASYREKDRRKKGYRALTRGLVAVAVGDSKRATHFSKQTKSYLNGENGLPVLLEAQAARLRGEEGLAQNKFELLMKDKDAAFLGIRGLLKSAIDEGNMALALDYARRAQELHPHQEWILRTTYDLEIRNGLWSDALETGKRALKIGALSEQKAISDRIAIHLMRYDYETENGDPAIAIKQLKQAYRLNNYFVPTVTRLASYYIHHNKHRKAAKIIEQAWPHNPHPDLTDLWMILAPEKQNKKLKWSEKLVALNTDSAESQIAAARAAMDMNLWGEAKAYLTVAEKIHPSARVFRQRAIVEQNSTQNDDAIHDLMEKAANALPDKKWVCRQTGLTYDSWSAIALPHESFNTIIWDYPGARTLDQKAASFIDQKNTLMIDPAA